jgi:uncharacterized protein YukE
MEDIYEFAIDTTKLDNLIRTIKQERDNMDNAVKTIYKTFEEIGDYWEGDAYNSAKENLIKYQKPLESSVEIIDELIKILKDDKKQSKKIMNKIASMVSEE